MTVEITVDPTRSEAAIRFLLDREIIPPGTGLSFPSPESAEIFPIAKALFKIKGVLAVWVLGNEIMVTKDEKTRWGSLKPKVIETIRSTFNSQ
ncbi:MAG: NifU N-terminal domain-containing protein [Nitrospinales bacterium]